MDLSTSPNLLKVVSTFRPVFSQQLLTDVEATPMRGYASPQPHYSQSPQQHSHYPPQVSRAPSNSYNNHPQGQYQHMQNQQSHPSSVSVEGGESMK